MGKFRTAVVIGGGVAGIESALNISAAGFPGHTPGKRESLGRASAAPAQELSAMGGPARTALEKTGTYQSLCGNPNPYRFRSQVRGQARSGISA